MPDPISSTIVPLDMTCSSEPDFDCEPELLSSMAMRPGTDACRTADPLPANASASASASASAELARRYLQTDHTKLIAATTLATTPTRADESRVFFASTYGPGAQFQPEVGASRTTVHAAVDGVHLTGTLDFFTAGAHLGLENDDGSHGANLGAAATLAGLEVTAEYNGWSFTFGESLSLGASVSSGGTRDIDQDGVRERCFKGSLGPLTLGFCDEL